MTSLRADINATRQALGRVVESLTGDPVERAAIAANAAFEFIALDESLDVAIEAFAGLAADPPHRNLIGHVDHG